MDTLPLLQTVIRSDLSIAGIIVAIFIYLLKHQKDDCDRYVTIKHEAPDFIPFGFDDIRFTLWNRRLSVYLWVTFLVLVLMIFPPVAALIWLCLNLSWSTLLFRVLTGTTAVAMFLLIVTFGNFWWKTKYRSLPPELRPLV